MRPATCVTSSSSKQRTTCAMALRLADVGEELVAEAFAFGGAGDQARDVDEFHRRRDDLLRIHDAGSTASRSSGTATTPTFGSIVQNG